MFNPHRAAFATYICTACCHICYKLSSVHLSTKKETPIRFCKCHVPSETVSHMIPTQLKFVILKIYHPSTNTGGLYKCGDYVFVHSMCWTMYLTQQLLWTWLNILMQLRWPGDKSHSANHQHIRVLCQRNKDQLQT